MVYGVGSIEKATLWTGLCYVNQLNVKVAEWCSDQQFNKGLRFYAQCFIHQASLVHSANFSHGIPFNKRTCFWPPWDRNELVMSVFMYIEIATYCILQGLSDNACLDMKLSHLQTLTCQMVCFAIIRKWLHCWRFKIYLICKWWAKFMLRYR